MEGYSLSLFLHLISAILVVGMALYWTIMVVALGQKYNQVERFELLKVLNRARWPHVIVPYAFRLPLSVMTLLITGLVVISGSIILYIVGTPGSVLWWVKLLMTGVVIVIQVILMRNPVQSLIHINFVLVLTILVLSGLLLR